MRDNKNLKKKIKYLSNNIDKLYLSNDIDSVNRLNIEMERIKKILSIKQKNRIKNLKQRKKKLGH